MKLVLACSLSGAGLGLSGCEECGIGIGPYGRYDYDFYPDSGVYYHFWTGSYFYYWDGAWIRSKTLPVYIVLNPSYRRRVYIRDRYPYTRHWEHRRRFPGRTRRPPRSDRIISEHERTRIERERRRREELSRDRYERYRVAREQRRKQQQRPDLRRDRPRTEQERQRRADLKRKRRRTEEEEQRRWPRDER